EICLFVNGKENLSGNAVKVVREYFSMHPECVFVYGDEDEWNSNHTVRMNPWFKPDFSPDTLLSYFYYGNVFAVRAERLKDIIWKASDDYLLNLYDMCMQLSFPVKKDAVGHIQYVLYHAEHLKALCTDEQYDEVKKKYSLSLQEQTGNKNDLLWEDNVDKSSVFSDGEGDKISVVIPTKDHPEILRVCLQSLINTGENEEIEIIVVDNGSSPDAKEKYEELKNKFKFNYIFKPMDFNFSRMCNLGAEAATGQFLLFLNDDIEAKDEGWMSKMRFHAAKSHVGAVGAKLYYPNSKTIQHAGITNLRLGPVHKMQFLEDTRSYYDGRNRFDRNVVAVTAACLMVRKTVFAECGGFSEELAVAFNDVEFCFRLYEAGYYNVQCNEAVLYHHESLSRGNDESVEKQIRLQEERRKMYAMHPNLYGMDPFYHPYMNTNILDTNFSFAYEYPAGEELDFCEPTLIKGGLKQEWYNDCLLISMEYADD
ncbi:MAG: glycosyltransferase, partial [Lachnospiraceae bacterium]|nr:glycosyltransferase [Lachnospiraceae bacterium]